MGYQKSVLVAMLLVAASPLHALSAEMPGGPGGPGGFARLGGPGVPPPPCFQAPMKHPLSDPQRKAISELTSKFELETAQTAAELRVSERRLNELLRETNIDKSAASTLQDRINSLRTTLANARLGMQISMHDVLTEEQRSEMPFMMPPCMPFGPPPCMPFGPPPMPFGPSPMAQ